MLSLQRERCQMIDKQVNQDQLPGDHQANDPVRSDMQEYYNDTLKLNHPSNRRRTDQEKQK